MVRAEEASIHRMLGEARCKDGIVDIARRQLGRLAAVGTGAFLPPGLLSPGTAAAAALSAGKWGDQGDGTYVNPVLPGDFSDWDCIRVGSDYYGITSTFGYPNGTGYVDVDSVQYTVAPTRAYQCVSVRSGKVANVSGASNADGAAVIQWTGNGKPNQQWAFQSTADGYHTIMCVSSGKVPDVAGSSTADGARIVQTTAYGQTSHQWQLRPLTGGAFTVVNRNSGKVLDVDSGSTADGAAVIQYSDRAAPTSSGPSAASPPRPGLRGSPVTGGPAHDRRLVPVAIGRAARIARPGRSPNDRTRPLDLHDRVTCEVRA
jgi:hypothetical protein